MHRHPKEADWRQRAMIGFGFTLMCVLLEYLSSGQGYSTVNLFGADVGIQHIKSLTFLVVGGDRFQFPFDLVVYLVAVASCAFGAAAVWKHREARRTHA